LTERQARVITLKFELPLQYIGKVRRVHCNFTQAHFKGRTRKEQKKNEKKKIRKKNHMAFTESEQNHMAFISKKKIQKKNPAKNCTNINNQVFRPADRRWWDSAREGEGREKTAITRA
jgi:hypothetical protein